MTDSAYKHRNGYRFCYVCLKRRGKPVAGSSDVETPHLLGFATLDKAAALGLATSRAVTDLRQYINSDLGYSDLKI